MKTITKFIIGAVIGSMLAIALTNHILEVFHRKQIKEVTQSYESRIEELQFQKDSVQFYADSVDVVLARYKALLDSFAVVDLTHQEEIDRLEIKLEKALEEVKEASYDDNYDFLQRRYITTDTLQYPFSGEQVSAITIDVVTGEIDSALLAEERQLSLMLREQMAVRDEIIETISQDRDALRALANSLYARLEGREEELLLKDEEIGKLKKALRGWKIGSIGAGAFLLIILLLL